MDRALGPHSTANDSERSERTPFVFPPALGPRTSRENPKRRRGGALQNLAEVRVTLANAPASWSAAALRRFRREPHAEDVRLMDSPLSGFFAFLGNLNLPGNSKAPQGAAHSKTWRKFG